MHESKAKLEMYLVEKPSLNLHYFFIDILIVILTYFLLLQES